MLDILRKQRKRAYRGMRESLRRISNEGLTFVGHKLILTAVYMTVTGRKERKTLFELGLRRVYLFKR